MQEEKRKNKKGGRPRLETSERRTEKLSAVVTPALKLQFHKLCEAQKTTTSDLLLGLIVEFLEKQGGEQ